MERMKRAVCLLLCIVMVVGLLPMSAFAATGTPTIVIAGSDYQDPNSGTNMTAIMNTIKKTHSSVHGILMGGDYDAGDIYPTASHLEAVDATIDAVYPGIESDKRIYIQGNHETYCRDGSLEIGGDNLLSATGKYDTDYYGVYAINYEDFGSAASGLQTYLEGKTGYTKPIFVMSHQPLHVTSRGDNNAATDLFDVLNAYSGLNIIFLFGHNHSGGFDAYLGNGSIYLPKGSNITVAGGSTEKLNFTYMNYGYVGYVNNYSGTTTDTTLTMTAFEIYEDEVHVKRYDASGLHNLKAAGATVSGYNTDSNVYGTAVIDLETGESTITPLSDDSTTGSGTTGGTTGTIWRQVDSITTGKNYMLVNYGNNASGVGTYAVNSTAGATAVTVQTDSTGAYVVNNDMALAWTAEDGGSYHFLKNADTAQYLNSSNYGESSGTALSVATVTSTYSDWFINNDLLSVSNKGGSTRSYPLAYSGSAFVTYGNGETPDNGVVIFEETDEIGTGSGTGTGGGSTVTPEGGDWVTISSGVGGTIYTLDTDGVSTGENYLIVSTGTDGKAQALRNNNGTVSSAEVTISNGQIVTSETDIVWTYDTSKYLSNNSKYLYLTGGSSISLGSSKRAMAITSNSAAEGAYTVKRSDYSYYLNYSNGSWTNGSSADDIYFFVESGTEAAGDAEYAKLVGELTYTVARGASAEDALATVMGGLNVVVSADKSAETTLEDSKTDITWTLADSYDGSVPGEYAVTISYKGVKLGTAKVIVPAVDVDHTACDESGSVKAGATGNVRTGAYITVFYEDGTTQKIPVTLNMLKDADGNAVDTTLAEDQTSKTITGLKVYYNGECVCENFTLTVRAPSSYPEYPDEGAVQVGKTGTGIQFQSTGVAQVEISASGIPMNQGVDILLILDTSSSMGEAGSLTSGSRMSVLQECVNALIQSLKAERADGSVPDVDFSVVDFAGYLDYKSVNYIESVAKSTSEAQRGAVLLDWTSVQNVEDTWANGLTEKSGTNYDHGLQMGYDQLLAKQQQDEGTRKQFVLFMSDGAPFQYNGVGSSETGEGNAFEKWLLGTYTQDEVDALKGDHFNNPEFYYESEGGAQKNRIAEAIKGSADETFYIPSYTETNGTWKGELVGVPGLGATMYSVGYALVEDYGKNPTGLAGMNAILSTIASVSEDTGKKLFYPVKSKDDLVACFDDFAGEALMSATNARFVDQMGDAYDLQMGNILDLNDHAIGVENKIEVLSYDIWTRAEYLAGEVTADKIGDRKGTYTVLETVTFNADGTEAYSDKDSTGPNGETIAAGQNILIGGVIYAQSFWYNSNPTAVEVTGVDIPTGVDSTTDLTTGSTNVLPAETFYWKVGTIKTTELAMRYYVYLTGSMEGTREAGSYPTNNYADLYYNNYLNQPVGQPCHQDTVSPVLAWDAANVSYAFYLVDENGNIIVNQTTGEIGSFANKIAVTNPVVYEEVLLNNTDTVESIEVASSGVLPAGYELYDTGAVYTIEINSDATGSWTIQQTGATASTYVTQYDPTNAAAYSNELSRNSDADFTHTVVWFAVLWKIQALPDTVVVDYGLPVDISVLTNDMFGEAGKLAGVGAYSDSLNLDGHTTTLASGFGEEYLAATNTEDMLSYGDAKAYASTGKVRYTLNTTEMNGYDKFAYAVNYTGATNPGYYYDTVTVIPATTIYYEDNFLTYESFTWDNQKNTWVERAESLWVRETEVNGTQAEDRPGEYSLTDANNIYGYDAVNLEKSTYSLDHAAMATVNYDNKAHASFTFWGTGFDIISMTSNTTGNILVDVERIDGGYIKLDDEGNEITEINFAVDTYYGYKQDENGNWVVDSNASGSLYQVPIIKMANQPYGQYRVTIKASYDPAFDHVDPSQAEGSYDFYLDAIRIYDPANDGAEDDDTVIEDAYKADGEAWPTYFELRNHLISTGTLGNATSKIVGEVFIDGDATVGDAQLADYLKYGPNNEVYLNKNQSVAFLLSDVTVQEDGKNVSIVDQVHIGIKSADGADVTYTIKNIASNSNTDTGVNAGDKFNEKTYTINTATDMYYDITGWRKDIIVITNTSDGILSLTNIKATYTQNPDDVSVASGDDLEDDIAAVSEYNQNMGITLANVNKQSSGATILSAAVEMAAAEAETTETASNEVYAYMTPSAAELTLCSLNAPVVEEPEETEPTEPDVTEPEETEPTEPDSTEPEETEPTEPEEPAPESPAKKIIKKIIRIIGGWFDKWF